MGVPCRVIQETLVEIGDKEAGFVGSSRWIGAIELSYVLDQLLGVSATPLCFGSIVHYSTTLYSTVLYCASSLVDIPSSLRPLRSQLCNRSVSYLLCNSVCPLHYNPYGCLKGCAVVRHAASVP